MRISRSDLPRRALGGFALLGTAAGFALLPGVPAEAGAQQLRDVISHEVAVARGEAALHVEFTDDASLDISLRDGVIRIGDDEIGRYEPGDPLDTAWRELLGRAVVLADGPLATALLDWEPPTGPTGEIADAGARIDAALEAALEAAPARTVAPSGDAVSESALLSSLLGRTDRLVELAGAIEGLELGDVRVVIDEDLTVDEGESVGSLIVVDGDLEVLGEVRGDVVMVGGTLRTLEGSLITGDVRLADARLVREGGEIEGDWSQVEGIVGTREMRERIREEIRRELRDEIRTDLRRELRGAREDDGWSVTAPFRSFGRGLAALVGDVMKTFVLALIGGAAVFFARRNVEIVAESARRAPGRAAVVGLAGSFLVLPVYVLGGIALAISIIGLPVLLAWIPLFPVAVGLAAGMGFYAVAANVGEWLASRRYPGTDWIRGSNLYTLVVGGVVALMVPFLAADVVRMAGDWMGFLRGLLTVIGVLATVAATVVGFGAVLLTRAGRRPEHYRGTDFFDDDWDFDGPASPPPHGPSTGPSAGGAGGDWFGADADAASATGPAGTARGTGAAGAATGDTAASAAASGTGARDRGADDTTMGGTGARRTTTGDATASAGPDETTGETPPPDEAAPDTGSSGEPGA